MTPREARRKIFDLNLEKFWWKFGKKKFGKKKVEKFNLDLGSSKIFRLFFSALYEKKKFGPHGYDCENSS